MWSSKFRLNEVALVLVTVGGPPQKAAAFSGKWHLNGGHKWFPKIQVLFLVYISIVQPVAVHKLLSVLYNGDAVQR